MALAGHVSQSFAAKAEYGNKIVKNKTIKNHIVIYKKDFTNELLKEKVNVITFKP